MILAKLPKDSADSSLERFSATGDTQRLATGSPFFVGLTIRRQASALPSAVSSLAKVTKMDTIPFKEGRFRLTTSRQATAFESAETPTPAG